MDEPTHRPVPLSTETPIWSRFFTVAPLVVVGTREGDGHDLAPKHMAMPLGWQNYFCFVCSPKHATHANVERTGEFTVSFPRPDQIVEASLAAAPREEDDSKPSLEAIPTFPAGAVDGVLVSHAYLWLECELDRIVDGFGENTLIVGRVVAAAADEGALRDPERDDAELIDGQPLLAYLSPGRFATISGSYSFPYHLNFKL
ncbi:MAG: flavin reductase family protein [Syntrophothermus sp.]